MLQEKNLELFEEIFSADEWKFIDVYWLAEYLNNVFFTF